MGVYALTIRVNIIQCYFLYKDDDTLLTYLSKVSECWGHLIFAEIDETANSEIKIVA